MSENIKQIRHNVPSFESVEDLRSALNSKGGPCTTDLYPRDGTTKLNQLEARFAQLARVKPEDLVLCSSGMSAVVNTLEAITQNGDTVACAWQTYSQTGVYVAEQLIKKGIRVVFFDSGSPDDIERVISKNKPSVIFSETVSNGPDTPVLDAEQLLEACEQAEIDPYIVLDNTLPLSTGYDLSPLLEKNQKVIGVESATKSYAFNTELAGIIYSHDQTLVSKLRQHRITKGFGPNLTTIAALDDTLPESREEFDRRNTRIFTVSKALAHCVASTFARSSEFTVSHPSLPSHANSNYAQRKLVDGSSPIFYIQCTGSTDQFELADQLWSNPAVREHCELGQSFGFDKTRILPNQTYPVVRIAAGATTDSVSLCEAIKAVEA